MSLSEQDGVRLRATVSEFGPVLISRILGVTETQAGIISVIFKYCDDNKLPLLDLKDFKKILQYATNEGKKEFEELRFSYNYITPIDDPIRSILITAEQQAPNRIRFNHQSEYFVIIDRYEKRSGC